MVDVVGIDAAFDGSVADSGGSVVDVEGSVAAAGGSVVDLDGSVVDVDGSVGVDGYRFVKFEIVVAVGGLVVRWSGTVTGFHSNRV